LKPANLSIAKYVERSNAGAPPPETVRVSNLLENKHLELRLVAGEEFLDREVRSPELNRPALELTGFFDRFCPERIQIFGSGELTYLMENKDNPEVMGYLEKMFSYDVPCVIVSNNRDAPDFLCEMGLKHKKPILVSAHHTTKLYKRVWEALDLVFAPRTLMHGVLVDVFGVGVLILGKSGVGKSECALELVGRRHLLVADDLVEIRLLAASVLMGYANKNFPYHMEVRGLGIVDVNRIFGASAISRAKRIRLVVVLEQWDEKKEYERLGIEDHYCDILEMEIPALLIPVCPGRDISSIIEVGALRQKQRRMGVDPAKEMNERLIEMTRRKASTTFSLSEEDEG